MAKRKGFKVNATVVTPDEQDKFPVVDSNDVAGGYMYFYTLSEANQIPEAKRKKGMMVYIESEDARYTLVNNHNVLDDSYWKKETSSEGGSSGNINTVQITENEFTVTENNLPYVTEYDLPTTGPVIVQVTKEVEEQVSTIEETNATTFDANAASLFTINSSDENPAFVTIDDNGLRMTDCYVDTPINLQTFADNATPLVQGNSVDVKTQLIIADTKFDLTGINSGDFSGISVAGSVGSNNYIGVIIRIDSSGSDFGVGLGFDFEENKWIGGMTDFYNTVSLGKTETIQFDTDFKTTITNTTTNSFNNQVFYKYSIPVNKLADIPADKWQELFSGQIALSSKTNLGSGEVVDTNIPALDPAKAQICFVFGSMDETQACRVTGISMKATTTTTLTKQVPAISPTDFRYDLITKTGKTAIRFEWSGWQADMSGKVYCTNLYYPLS